MLCDRLGIRLPIAQAPIGSAATPELAAAVASAGGLGMLAPTWVTPQQAIRQIRRVRQLTDRPFGVNLVLEFPVDHVLDACLGEGVPVVSTFWGFPAGVAERAHAAGALHLHTVGTAEEARRPVGAGVDVVVDWRGHPQLRYGYMIPMPGMTGDLEAMAMYAGQSAGLIREVAPGS